MNNLEKILQVSMWVVVALAILIFVISIIVGHTNSFNFFYQISTNTYYNSFVDGSTFFR